MLIHLTVQLARHSITIEQHSLRPLYMTGAFHWILKRTVNCSMVINHQLDSEKILFIITIADPSSLVHNKQDGKPFTFF
ncbi:hypothetical protein DPMN_074162 [Dreissena polymorpha]|uniref:Uncharacterized protein n=1 Tax=Dreissena polymorpha TaxID=45954 RepID=A0A9D3YET7_DREPO|nr:hypothetical protein DPMN_074162 [Dreissena polymorpha]